jgi:hypothetical protein
MLIRQIGRHYASHFMVEKEKFRKAQRLPKVTCKFREGTQVIKQFSQPSSLSFSLFCLSLGSCQD